MAAHLAQRHAHHHLARVVLPAGAAERRDQQLDRRLVVRRHQPPRHLSLVDQVDPRAFIDQAGAQHALAGDAELVAVGEPGDVPERREIVGEAGGRHLVRGDAELAEHRRRRRALARERREGGDALETDVAIVLVAQPPVEHRLHRLDHLAARRIGQGQPGLGGDREEIGGERLGALERVRRPIARQPGHRDRRGSRSRSGSTRRHRPRRSPSRCAARGSHRDRRSCNRARPGAAARACR